MNFAEVIKRERRKRNYTQQELADALHVSASTVGMWEQDSRVPKLEKLEEIADFFNINLDELRGQDSMDIRKGIRIPVLGSVRAGIPLEAIEDIVDYEEIPEVMARNGEYFGLLVKGDSMSPVFVDGDTVIVRKQDSADTGDSVIAMINGDEATIKRLKRTEDGIILIPNNPQYLPMTYSNDQIKTLPVRILGKVVELRRKF